MDEKSHKKINVAVVWYSLCDDKGDRDKMIRIGGNVWKYESSVENNKLKYEKK